MVSGIASVVAIAAVETGTAGGGGAPHDVCRGHGAWQLWSQDDSAGNCAAAFGQAGKKKGKIEVGLKKKNKKDGTMVSDESQKIAFRDELDRLVNKELQKSQIW